ncbi:flagellar hook-associated protein FlgK [Devosia sp. MC521]|uniref:flagellar hook-associated protein FlgK n=1 Tax=Devosia sp. MC521 TaxID=2759954 RepID=UPI0015FCED13|nr:flagellar hook-associated protein FlgK [Devosia sp. MC521]MBJ6986528.1 flagellar hook-associated protein FlgK [Devosia sp. MC521]QMW61574.1 flagellar hook-associated protein FlgK [Devosia sp. MC521]
MGLMSSLSNAVSGLRTNQDAISVLSRNVSNAGTPGYHRQALNIVDYNTENSSYARTVGVNRAFSQSLQTYYNRQVSDTSASNVMTRYLSKLDGVLGKPGSAGSLDTLVGSLKNSLHALATSPDDYSTRADVVSHAQTFANRLNELSTTVQGLRKDTETQIQSNVTTANAMLNSLDEVNKRMLDLGMTDTARASLMDQRDRLVAGLAEIIDVQADYRPDGSVALMTRSGVGLLDNGPSSFNFVTAGALSPTTQASIDPELNKVGILTLTTPSGLTIDLVKQGVLGGGELAALVELRDKTLVETQNQLDEIAASVASVFSTITAEGRPVTQQATQASGFVADISHLKSGNDILFRYSENGEEQRVRVVNSTVNEDYVDASGQRVVSFNFGSPPDAGQVASTLQSRLSFLQISGTDGNLQILDDGPEGTRDITALTTRGTATGMQQGELAFSLFTDGAKPYSGSTEYKPGQIVGFASRITINADVLSDNRLLVQYDLDSPLGDASRPEYVLKQLQGMSFVSGTTAASNYGRHQLNGSLEQIVGQVLNFQGSTIGNAQRVSDHRQLTLDTISEQMDADYGVDMDEEMARLTQLQSTYAANARVMSVVQELLDTLMQAV